MWCRDLGLILNFKTEFPTPQSTFSDIDVDTVNAHPIDQRGGQVTLYGAFDQPKAKGTGLEAALAFRAVEPAAKKTRRQQMS